MLPASAVVADLVDIARTASHQMITGVPALSFQSDQVKDLNVLEDSLTESGFYGNTSSTTTQTVEKKKETT